MKKSLLVSVIVGLCLPHYVVFAGGGEAEERAPSHAVFSAAAAQADTGAGVEDFDEEKGGKRKASRDEFDRHTKQELMDDKTETVSGVEGIGKRGSGTRESIEPSHQRTVRSRATQEVKNNWKHLPEEIILGVLKFCSFQDLGKVAQVSRQSKRLADDVRERRFKDPHLYTTYFENAPTFWTKIMKAAIRYIQGNEMYLSKYRAFLELDYEKINDLDGMAFEFVDKIPTRKNLMERPLEKELRDCGYTSYKREEERIEIEGVSLSLPLGPRRWVSFPRGLAIMSQFFNDSYSKAQNLLDRMDLLSVTCNLRIPGLHILPAGAFINFHELTTLNLNYCSFGGRVPSEVLEVTTLTDLRLNGNALRELPDSLFVQLPLLRNLSARSNDIKEIPSSIGNAINLIRLNIGVNREISAFPSSMERLRNLTSLYMFCLDGMTEFPSVVGRLPSLTLLGADHNNFSSIPSDVLRQMTSLMELRADSARLEDLLSLPNLSRATIAGKTLTINETDYTSDDGPEDEEPGGYEPHDDWHLDE